MIQTGDPTGTGKGGKSIYERPFEDEFKSNLTHNAAGVVSMANKGKNTNSSQLYVPFFNVFSYYSRYVLIYLISFLTFAPCNHLNNKHTVFGKIVGGGDVLYQMERVPTDSFDKPKVI